MGKWKFNKGHLTREIWQGKIPNAPFVGKGNLTMEQGKLAREDPKCSLCGKWKFNKGNLTMEQGKFGKGRSQMLPL